VAEALSIRVPHQQRLPSSARVLALRYFYYQSDVYKKMVDLYYPIRGLAVLGEGCRGVLD
jgi:hypothetical protein